ncbi:MAG: hypothetical protein MUC48_21280 [Leptolyngbya sp. Prado105]|jgi:hypothetical protein|nr:hypothetical protein [Leptolyngbya sp. Prado105]
MKLPHYEDLYYADPQTEFEQTVNDGLDSLCVLARGCGPQALQAQHRLKYLKQCSIEGREQLYRAAIESQESNPKTSHDHIVSRTPTPTNSVLDAGQA